MKVSLRLIAILIVLCPLVAYGGGDPEFVRLPDGYENSFSKYATINRSNGKQVAKLYANIAAIASHIEGNRAASGSILIMEIYKPQTDAEGKPITGEDGIFEIDALEAIAVMENRHTWGETFSEENRTGDWGYALYSPNGTPKSNDLDCVQCHMPLKEQDYMFTYQMLVDFAKSKQKTLK